MNILNILFDFHPGGVERLAVDVANQLARQGQNSYVCIISNEYSRELVAQFSPQVQLIFLKRYNNFRKIHYLLQLNKVIRHNKIEIMHIHQGVLLSFYMLVKLMNPGLKIYYTVHDTYLFTELSPKNKLLAGLVCRKLVAISDAVKEDIAKNGIKETKIVRIYNGVDFSRFDIRENQDRKEGDLVAITNAARLYPAKKGQDILIKAVSLLKQEGYRLRVNLAGGPVPDDPDAMKRMQDLCKEWGLEEEVKILGNVDNIPDLLEQTDIFVMASRFEGFGIAAVEAMGMGIPCVASNIAGLNEVIDSDMVGRLFSPGDEKELAASLKYVIEHIDSYQGDEIALNARCRFSIENMAGRLVNVYGS